MVRVAVAGATGELGYAIVEQLTKSKKHEVVVLSRAPNANDDKLKSFGAEFIPVSYSDPSSLDKALANVHTVISAIFTFDADVFISNQIALLDAAKRVGAKRFVPSEFNVIGQRDDAIFMYRPKPTVVDAVRKSGLEYTLFETGIFMDNFAVGAPGDPGRTRWTFMVDVAKHKADIPGDGESKVAFTSLEDIARFVEASLDLDKWPEVSRLAGDIVSLNQVVAAAEAVLGQKFDVSYRKVEELEAELKENPKLSMIGARLDVTRGRFDLKDLNTNKQFPHIKPLTVAEFLQKWWGNGKGASV